MKDVSGVKWAVQGGHVGGYGPLMGRFDVPETPDTFSPTPGLTPDPEPEATPKEVPDSAGSEPPE